MTAVQRPHSSSGCLRPTSRGSTGSAGSRLSRSTPKLSPAASFDLRSFSAQRKPLMLQRATARCDNSVQLDTVKAQGMRRVLAERQERWRQREEDEAGVEAAQRKQEARDREKEKERDAAERKRRQDVREKEMLRQHRKDREAAEQREREMAAQLEQRRLEEERRQAEAEERERLRRTPKTCEECKGSGKCIACEGKGFELATYIVTNLDPLYEYGRKPLGCQRCGGHHDGLRGELKRGDGRCFACHGFGKIWPKLDDRRRRRKERKATKEPEVTPAERVRSLKRSMTRLTTLKMILKNPSKNETMITEVGEEAGSDIEDGDFDDGDTEDGDTEASP